MSELERVGSLVIGQNFLHDGVRYARLPEMNLRIGGAVTWVNCARVCPVAVPAPGPRGFEPQRILAEYIHPDTHVEVASAELVAMESRPSRLPGGVAAPEPEPTVPAESFLSILHINVDNWALGDLSFRNFVRDSLPVVVYPRPGEDRE